MAVNLTDGNSTSVNQENNNIQIEVNFPVGFIYMSVNDTDPSTYFGGTWQRIAKGKTLVGVDENDTDFASSQLTGGEKTHTLTVNEIPAHTHTYNKSDINNYVKIEASSAYGRSAGYNSNTGSTGGGQAHNNMQPYVTCYMWVRVS